MFFYRRARKRNNKKRKQKKEKEGKLGQIVGGTQGAIV